MINPESGPAPGPRILLVDDDRLILSTLGSELAAQGYEVLFASSGKESVRLAQERVPDLVIMDVRMPDISGIEAARAIRETSGVPVLFLSAFEEQAIVHQAVSEGGLGYLVKPVGPNQLVPAVEAALARGADLRKLRTSEENLRIALAGDRAVSVAIGILMERYRIRAEEAFERLRRYARSRQRKIDDVAKEAVDSVELITEIGRSSAPEVRGNDETL